MALTLETGAGSPDADSFVSVVEARAYASARGLDLPADDAAVEILCRRAADYLVTKDALFQGTRAVAGQALPFPREGVWLYGEEQASDAIPNAVKRVACQLVADLVDNDPQATGSGREVLTSTVGPISTTYAASGRTAVLPVLTRVEAMLAPLYASGGTLLTTVRV